MVICSIWFSNVWLNWLFPYVICVGVVMTMEVGATVPPPKLSEMTVNPWLLLKFGISFRKSKLVGVLYTTKKAPKAKALMTITIGTFRFRVLFAIRFRMFLLGLA